MRYAVIMAGGAGTRLWPMSTKDLPKQLIPFIGRRSLLEIAADRLEGLVDAPRQLICTGESFRKPIRAALPRFTDEQILGEPQGRDTLAAVGFPAAVVAQHDADAIIATFTADHLIEPIDEFQRLVDLGYRIVEQQPETLVTFGIEPTHPATGYGYVRLGEALSGFDGAFTTLAFREKPDEQTAQQYVESGEYRWNSGMFVWRAATLLRCIEKYAPPVHAGLMEIADAWTTDQRRAVLDRVYPTLKKTSVDYGVMEPASNDPDVPLATVSMPVKWLDVGDWPAYGMTIEPDGDANRIAADKVAALASAENIIVSDRDDHLIATLGVNDLIIVHTDKATLICNKADAQDIKKLHALVKEQIGDDYV